MAAPILCRTLISFPSDNNFSLLRKSHTSFSLYFSTTPPLEPHAITRFLIDNNSFSPDAAAQIASKTRLKSRPNADSILSFLTHTGFSTAQLQRFAQSSPHLLSANLDANIKPKFDLLRDLGFTCDEIAVIVSTQSRVLHYSASRISTSIIALKSVLGSTAAVAKFITAGGLFLRDMETSLLPNVEILKSCGVPTVQILREMRIPRFFLQKPEQMRKCVDKAERMGSDRNSRSFISAVRIVSSMTEETWGMKMKTLRDLGFSDGDMVKAFKNSPSVFAVSVEKMRRVVEVLDESGKYDRGCLASSPVVFLYSIEKRILPRLKVLRVLEEKKLIGNWPCLTTMVLMTNGNFFDRFVKGNVDHVGELWSGVCGEDELKVEEI